MSFETISAAPVTFQPRRGAAVRERAEAHGGRRAEADAAQREVLGALGHSLRAREPHTHPAGLTTARAGGRTHGRHLWASPQHSWGLMRAHVFHAQ